MIVLRGSVRVWGPWAVLRRVKKRWSLRRSPPRPRSPRHRLFWPGTAFIKRLAPVVRVTCWKTIRTEDGGLSDEMLYCMTFEPCGCTSVEMMVYFVESISISSSLKPLCSFLRHPAANKPMLVYSVTPGHNSIIAILTLVGTSHVMIPLITRQSQCQTFASMQPINLRSHTECGLVASERIPHPGKSQSCV